MNRYLVAISMAVALSGNARSDTAAALITPGTLGLFADGTWDCKDQSGNVLGSIVLADLSYVFVDPHGVIGSYGKLAKDDWVDAPAFFILSGALKEVFGAVGMSLGGPVDRPEDLSDWNKLQLKVVVSAESIFRCDRRRGPST